MCATAFDYYAFDYCLSSHESLTRRVLLQMKKELEREDVLSVYSCYKHFASKADVELRRCCAQQLGSLVKVTFMHTH
jgi:hypothetical protein